MLENSGVGLHKSQCIFLFKCLLPPASLDQNSDKVTNVHVYGLNIEKLVI
jgi:hypothetical protein